MSIRIRSARLPGSRVPVILPMCIARAPSRVAIESAWGAGNAVGSLLTAFATNAARRTSSNISRSLFEAGPSVPMPTFRPISSILLTGAKPDASFKLDDGL